MLSSARGLHPSQSGEDGIDVIVVGVRDLVSEETDLFYDRIVDHDSPDSRHRLFLGRYNASMSNVNLQELQRDPNALLDRVEAGEHLVVVRGGRPVAELRPVPTNQSGPRPFGLCAGAFTVPDDFDAPLPEEILRGFERR